MEPEDGLLEGSDELPATTERSLLEARDESVFELWPDDAVLLATDESCEACELVAEDGVLGRDDWLVVDDGGSEDCVLESLAVEDGLPDAEGALDGGGDEPRLLCTELASLDCMELSSLDAADGLDGGLLLDRSLGGDEGVDDTPEETCEGADERLSCDDRLTSLEEAAEPDGPLDGGGEEPLDGAGEEDRVSLEDVGEPDEADADADDGWLLSAELWSLDRAEELSSGEETSLLGP